jgi:putative component of membrane protein insertase Oxa1/YidC/SpoIIIJ protein YidD
VRGLYLGTKRLLSCHSITWLGGRSGFDPVPQTFILLSRRKHHAQKYTP